MKKQNEKALFICNTVYQVLIALWIKYHTLNEKPADIFISDHMNNGKEIADKLNQLDLFDKAYYIKTHDYCYNVSYCYNLLYEEKEHTRFYRLHPELILKEFVQIESKYHTIYIANMDRFARLLVNSVRHLQNNGPKLILFEDGLSTYSMFNDCYERTRNHYNGNSIRSIIARKCYREYCIYGNIKYALVLFPDLMLWTPSENHKLDLIDKNDPEFLKIVNHVFNYKDDANEYNRKFIFMEESYFADGKNIGDVELIEKLAERVGKDNIMVKIHPRNPVNRFKELGYKTNANTSIPWEVVCMNMGDLSEKVLITIASCSVITPIMNFGITTKTYSLYDVLNRKNNTTSEIMDIKLWNMIRSAYEKYPNTISICSSIDEIQIETPKL